MAIDTETKRRSCIGIRGLNICGGFPTADGTLSAADRRQITGLYAGITTDVRLYSFWLENADGTSTWTPESDSSWTTTGTVASSSNWVPVREVRD